MATKYILGVLVIAFAMLNCEAQSVLLEQDVLADSSSGTTGPNRKNFFHTYASYGLPVAENFTGAEIILGRSATFNFGYRYKRKISNFYALGFEMFYEGNEFNLKQNVRKVLLDTTQHQRERIRFNQLGIGIYNRFNFGKRGDAIGNFLDLGAFGSWVFGMRHIAKDENPDGSKVKTKISGLDYHETWGYGVVARIGFNRFVLFGSYRLGNFFKEKYNYPELPAVSTGIQIGFH